MATVISDEKNFSTGDMEMLEHSQHGSEHAFGIDKEAEKRLVSSDLIFEIDYLLY